MKGFTLLEILMVVAIVGILAAIALPGYRNSQLRSVRAEGKSALLEVASMQERYYSANNQYSTSPDPLSSLGVATYYSTNNAYAVTVAACGTGTISNCFVATASPQGSQADDSCTTLTYTNTGVRGASGDTTDECWQR
jgi:type IV pilus assembly protein PilE